MRILPLSKDLLGKAVSLKSLGYDSVAWNHLDTVALIEELAVLDCVILGVDVIRVDDNVQLVPTCDSAYYEPTGHPDDRAYSRDCIIEYVMNYVEQNGEEYLFDITVDTAQHGLRQDEDNETNYDAQALSHAGIRLTAVNEMSDSFELATEFGAYHFLLNNTYAITKSSIENAARKFSGYYNRYPNNEVVIFDDTLMPTPCISLALMPEDSHSGHVAVRIECRADDRPSSITFQIVVDLSQIEKFGSSLFRVMNFGVGETAFLRDEISFNSDSLAAGA
jgi:hypothetical protein